MESLESKLDRLSPEQRKEIEDFVDFLLSRSGQMYAPLSSSPGIPPVLDISPPPRSMTEPVHVAETRPLRETDPLGTDDGTNSASRDDGSAAPLQEIGGGKSDLISHDYMDYGQFERQPSPATEAVKKVKARLNRSDEHDRSKHLLDWID